MRRFKSRVLIAIRRANKVLTKLGAGAAYAIRN